MIFALALGVAILLDLAPGPADPALLVALPSPLDNGSTPAHDYDRPGDRDVPPPTAGGDVTEADAAEKEEESGVSRRGSASRPLRHAAAVQWPYPRAARPIHRDDLLYQLHRSWQLVC